MIESDHMILSVFCLAVESLREVRHSPTLSATEEEWMTVVIECAHSLQMPARLLARHLVATAV